METNNKPFLSCNTGKNDKGFYAFHVEGFLGNDPDFYVGNEKTSFCRFSIGINKDAWSLVGEEGKHEESTFLNCTSFGDLAEKIKDLKKGQKIVVCGKPSRNDYETKAGKKGCNVQLIVDNLVALSCKAGDGENPSEKLVYTTNCYEAKDGQKKTQNIACLLTGKIIAVDEVKDVNGRKVINWQFAIEMPGTRMAALTNGTYTKKADYGNYKIIRCALWGPRAEKMDKVLKVGNILAVTGVPSVQTYEDRDYVNFMVRDFSVVKWVGDKKSVQPAAEDETEPEIIDVFSYNNDDDEEFELPF